MEQRPVGHGPGEIGIPAAARRINRIDGQDMAVIVEADLVIADEIVALAGDDHVVVAVRPQLHRPLQLAGRQRRDDGEQVGLGFLAAEPAAHAPDLDRDGMRADAEHLRHHVLHLARVLGRGHHQHVLILAGNGERDLALEVEMILTADRHRGLEPARTGLQRCGDIAALELQRLRDQRPAGFARRSDIEQRRGFFINRLGQQRRLPRLAPCPRHHRKERLAVMRDHIRRENRLVMAVRRGDVVDAGNIRHRQHGEHARRALDSHQVERDQPAMRDRAEAEIGMGEACRFRQIVDVESFARDMLGRGIVLAAETDRAGLRRSSSLLSQPSAMGSLRQQPRDAGGDGRFAMSRSGSAAADCRPR